MLATLPSDRQALERALAKLPYELAGYETELAAIRPEQTAERERLLGHMRRVRLRMEWVETELQDLAS